VSAKPRARRPAAAARAAAPSRAPAAATGAGAVAGAGGGGGEGTGSGTGTGGGDGSGGDGSGGAPSPTGRTRCRRPLVARRLGQEGLVLLDVLVAPDGSAADVQVRRSSGFPLLDQSAASTVRQRWRCVPARRGGTPVESRVTVPIRFRRESERG
jgi:protein TonB